MEVLEGSTLTEAMTKGPVTVKRAAHIIGEVCGALAAAHRVGVVHRDVKPDNVFLIEKMGETDYVKVLDFGVAKLTAPDGGAPLVSTMDGALIGTPVYMSPEQAAGQPVDHRSDIYAAGVMLYELLTGALPFNGANFGALAVQIITQAPPPLPERTRSNEPLPPALKQLVLRCLEKKAEHRPQSMDEVRQALAALERNEAVPIEADAAAIRRGPGPLVWAGLAALVLLVGGGLWALNRPPPEAPVVTVEPPPVEPPPVEPPPVEPPPVDPPPVEPPPPVQQKVLAKLGPNDVKQVVSRGGRDVQACIKRHRVALKNDRGEVKVAITVEPTGKVSQAEVQTAELAGTPLGKCVEKEVRQFVFPRFRGKAMKFGVPFSWNLSD
jgi:serine/threonine-protein kinase